MSKKPKKALTPEAPVEWPRADPAELAKFDPTTKECTMNCGQSMLDPRSRAEVMYLCDDCLPRLPASEREAPGVVAYRDEPGEKNEPLVTLAQYHEHMAANEAEIEKHKFQSHCHLLRAQRAEQDRDELRAQLAQQGAGVPVAWCDPQRGLDWLVDRMSVAPGTKFYATPPTRSLDRVVTPERLPDPAPSDYLYSWQLQTARDKADAHNACLDRLLELNPGMREPGK